MKNPSALVKAYILHHGLSVREFADRCKISNVTVYHLLANRRVVHPLTFYKIEVGTKGAIRYEDLTDIPRKKRYFERFSFKNFCDESFINDFS